MLSPDTENVLAYLDQSTPHGLRKRNDMGVLLELAAESDSHEVMNELIFHGRYLYNIYGTLRKTTPGAEGYKALEGEFTSAVEKVRDLMARLLVDADEESVERFNSQYYAMTQGGLRNIVDLAHDLGVMKSVQNDEKYGKEEGNG